MSEAMKYKLPPLPEPTALGMDFDKGWDGIRAYGYTEDDMQAYAIAAIEAQGVPDGYALVSKGALQMVVNVLQRDAANGMRVRGEIVEQLLASAPPALEVENRNPQAKPKPLSDEQIREAVNGAGMMFTAPDIKVARAIEAAHGIKGS